MMSSTIAGNTSASVNINGYQAQNNQEYQPNTCWSSYLDPRKRGYPLLQLPIERLSVETNHLYIEWMGNERLWTRKDFQKLNKDKSLKSGDLFEAAAAKLFLLLFIFRLGWTYHDKKYTTIFQVFSIFPALRF